MLVTPGVADAGGEAWDRLFVSASMVFSMGAFVGKVTRTLGETRGRRRGPAPALYEDLHTANKQIKYRQRPERWLSG